MKKHVIVGVDPGTTSGCALIDFSGKIVAIDSNRSWGPDGIIDFIIKHGRPSIIASDVDHAHTLAAKLASSFGVKSFIPKVNLGVEQKQDLVRGLPFEDAHQMDSLAAALNAYNHLENKLKNLKSKKVGDNISHLVLQGISLDAAKKMVQEKNKPKSKPVVKKTMPPVEVKKPKKQEYLEEKINELSKKLLSEHKKRNEFEKKYLSLKRKTHLGITKDDRVLTDKKIIADLKKELHQQKKRLKHIDELKKIILKIQKDDMHLVGEYPLVSHGITIIKSRLPKDYDLDSAQIVFTNSKHVKKRLEKESVQVFDVSELEEVEGIFFLSTLLLEKIRKGKKVSIKKIIDEYRKL